MSLNTEQIAKKAFDHAALLVSGKVPHYDHSALVAHVLNSDLLGKATIAKIVGVQEHQVGKLARMRGSISNRQARDLATVVYGIYQRNLTAE